MPLIRNSENFGKIEPVKRTKGQDCELCWLT